jgi:hypothetical protein
MNQRITLPLTLIRQRHITQHPDVNWFGPGETRFFRSRYPRCDYKAGDKAYFITSEQFVGSTDIHPRRWTIKIMDWQTGCIDTVGEFQEFETRKEAYARLKKIIFNALLVDQGINK